MRFRVGSDADAYTTGGGAPTPARRERLACGGGPSPVVMVRLDRTIHTGVVMGPPVEPEAAARVARRHAAPTGAETSDKIYFAALASSFFASSRSSPSSTARSRRRMAAWRTVAVIFAPVRSVT